MCWCQLASGEVVCRSVDGRLRRPRSWVRTYPAATGPTARCRGAGTYRATNHEIPWTVASTFAEVLPLRRILADCSAPWNWPALAIPPGRAFPGACSSSPNADGVIHPRKSLTILGLSTT